MDAQQQGDDILTANKYAVLATASLDGAPWASPVWFANVGTRLFLWVSSPESRHSRLIESNPQIALTVFDSQVLIGSATAFYGRAHARRSTEVTRRCASTAPWWPRPGSSRPARGPIGASR